jgi:hypothetical protein
MDENGGGAGRFCRSLRNLLLEDGVSLSTSGSVTDSGLLSLDYSNGFGGSTLSIGGALTNTGTLDIGAVSSSTSITAASFVNTGTVELAGSGTSFAALDVSGATTNNSSVLIAFDTEELTGAVRGTGSFSLLDGDDSLQFDSSVSAGQTIKESGSSALILDKAQSFAGTISGFGADGTIDATNFVETGTHYNFVENSAMTGGTLTLTDTTLNLTANILMSGDYSNSNFSLAHDSGTGTLVKFV